MIAVYVNEAVEPDTLARLRRAALAASVDLDALTLDEPGCYPEELSETAAMALAVELETP